MMQKPYELELYGNPMPNSLSIPEKLVCAKEAGYDFLKMSIDETDQKLARLDMFMQERLYLQTEMLKTELPIRSIVLAANANTLSEALTQASKKSMEIIEKAIQLACNLGVRMVMIPGYDVYYEKSTTQSRADFLKNLQNSVETASRFGVILAFETMETPFMNNVKKAMGYVRRINSPFSQVYPDIGNCTNAASYMTKMLMRIFGAVKAIWLLCI